MLVSEILTEIRNEANTNASKVSDPYLLTGVNLDYGELVMDILRAKTDFNFNAKEVYTNLVSTSGLTVGQNGYDGEYAFPSDLIRPIRVEISYDGNNWTPASFYDIGDNIDGSEHEDDALEANWSQSYPTVRFERDSFIIRPVKATTGNITGGIHIWYEKRQSALVAADTPLFEANYHRLLVLKGALRVMRKFRRRYNLADRNELRGEINKLTENMLEFYQNRFRKRFQIKPVYENMR